MEIQPGIHLLTDPIDDTTLTVTLIGERAGMVVDTGLPETPAQVILPYLTSQGRTAGWITTIVHTHCHTDHVAGDAALLALTEARVLIHRDEMDYLADPLAFVTLMQRRYGDGRRALAPDPAEVRRQYGPGTPADAGLEDGDSVVVEDRRWQVIHTPGHSAGGICLYEAATGTLITGDAIQAEGTTSCDLAFYFEADAYAASLQRVAALEIESIIAGHPFKPFPTAYLTGSEARRFLAVSQAAYERYSEQAPAILAGANRPLSTTEVAAALTARNGFDRLVGPAVQTTRAHLEQLRRRGEAVRLYIDGSWHWTRA